MSYNTFLAFGGLIGTRETDKATIDDFPFRLHYKVATAIVFLASALISATELVGQNIACHGHSGDDDMSENIGTFVERFCWIVGLYISPATYGAGQESANVEDGEGRECVWEKGAWFVKETLGSDVPEKCVKRVSYYQWIPYVLLIQGALFYLPRIFWTSMEEGKLTAMICGVKSAKKKEETENSKDGTIINNVLNYLHMKNAGHMQYGMCYVAAQFMLITNIFVAFWFNNLVLDGDFAWLGWKWAIAPNGEISYNTKSENTKLASDIEQGTMNKEELLFQSFPRRAACEVGWQGSAAGIQRKNYVCILGPNSLSQYVFLLLWFFYAALLIINVLNLVRIFFMIFRVGIFRNSYLMSATGTKKLDKELGTDTTQLSREVRRLNFGQFLFLYFVLRNSKTEFCQELLKELRRKGAPDWAKTKGQKKKDQKTDELMMNEMKGSRKSSNLPSYNSSMSNIPAQSHMGGEPQAPPLEAKSKQALESDLIKKYSGLSFTQESATMKKT